MSRNILEYARKLPKNKLEVDRSEIEYEKQLDFGPFTHFTNIGYESNYINWLYDKNRDIFEKQQQYDATIKSKNTSKLTNLTKNIIKPTIIDTTKTK